MKTMKSRLTFLLLLLSVFSLPAQNLSKALHLNEQEHFRGALPVTEIQETHHDLQSKKQTRTRSLYDAEQKIILKAVYENDQLRAKDTITYQNAVGVKKATIFEIWAADGTYERRTENYVYDTRGFLVRIREFSKDGYLRFETRIKNVGRGQPYVIDKFDDDDNLTGGTEEAEYLPERNRYVVKKMNVLGKESSRDTLVLDPQQQAAFPAKGETYNEKGDLIKSITPKAVTVYEYRYDEQGNWVEKKGFLVEMEKSKEKRILQEKWERKISYKTKP
jgi:YD repeat-containing protein